MAGSISAVCNPIHRICMPKHTSCTKPQILHLLGCLLSRGVACERLYVSQLYLTQNIFTEVGYGIETIFECSILVAFMDLNSSSVVMLYSLL